MIRDVDVIDASLDEIKSTFLDLCSAITKPISHDAHGTTVWDIKSNTSVTTLEQGIVTYSEHNHEADLHTDSQCSEYPEDFFALLTLKQATCGGG